MIKPKTSFLIEHFHSYISLLLLFSFVGLILITFLYRKLNEPCVLHVLMKCVFVSGWHPDFYLLIHFLLSYMISFLLIWIIVDYPHGVKPIPNTLEWERASHARPVWAPAWLHPVFCRTLVGLEPELEQELASGMNCSG